MRTADEIEREHLPQGLIDAVDVRGRIETLQRMTTARHIYVDTNMVSALLDMRDELRERDRITRVGTTHIAYTKLTCDGCTGVIYRGEEYHAVPSKWTPHDHFCQACIAANRTPDAATP